MSAEILRRAATLMRERAEACVSVSDAAEEPWYEVLDEGIQTKWHRFAEVNPVDAEHIASWHPAVALALADWLGSVADRYDQATTVKGEDVDRAVAVATAYLGEA